jgi:hypothetical protein
MATVALVVVSLPSTPLPRFAIVTPIAYFAALSVDFATAIVLLANWRTSPVLRSSFVLALAFTSNALLLLGAMLLLRLLPAVPAVVEGPAQAGAWLFAFWHASVAVGAFAYVAVRADDRIASRRYTLIAAAMTIGAVIGGFVIAFDLSGRLAPLAGAGSLTGIVFTGVGPFAAGLLALAALLAFRIREPTEIDRAYAFSILFLCIELSIVLIGVHRYSAILLSGRLLVLAGAMLVLVAAQRTLIASRSRLLEVEWTLGRVEGESAKRAGRIRAVWQIASYGEESAAEDFESILEIAAVALRPGKAFVGLLCHLDGGMLVIDATSSSAFDSSAPAAARSLFPGASFPAERTMANLLLGRVRARAWDDFVLVANASTVAEDLGFRSFIGSPIATDRGSYFVTFASPSPTADGRRPLRRGRPRVRRRRRVFFCQSFQAATSRRAHPIPSRARRLDGPRQPRAVPRGRVRGDPTPGALRALLSRSRRLSVHQRTKRIRDRRRAARRSCGLHQARCGARDRSADGCRRIRARPPRRGLPGRTRRANRAVF